MTAARTDSERLPDADRPSTIGGLLVSLASVAVSILSFGVLPDRIRIRWTVGGPYYGPEFAPTPFVLIAFPLLVVGLLVASYWLGLTVERTEAVDANLPAYDGFLLFGLATLLLVQIAIVAINLGYP